MANTAQNRAIHASDENKLLRAHLGEIDRKKADAFNIGHNVTKNSIGSKTDVGYLTTRSTPKGITHKWEGEHAKGTKYMPVHSVHRGEKKAE